jgi:hypothetical protein
MPNAQTVTARGKNHRPIPNYPAIKLVLGRGVQKGFELIASLRKMPSLASVMGANTIVAQLPAVEAPDSRPAAVPAPMLATSTPSPKAL